MTVLDEIWHFGVKNKNNDPLKKMCWRQIFNLDSANITQLFKDGETI